MYPPAKVAWKNYNQMKESQRRIRDMITKTDILKELETFISNNNQAGYLSRFIILDWKDWQTFLIDLKTKSMEVKN